MAKHIKTIGLLSSLLALLVSSTAAYVFWAYMTEYGSRRNFVVAIICLSGIGAAIVIYLFVSKCCKSVKGAAILLAILAALILVPLASMFYPGKITFSRFGFTVYGIIPVPLLDITVGSHGGLWFRDKSHFISIGEVQPLLSPKVEILVIGIGWDSAVEVDKAIRNMEEIEIHILSTPEAFDLFNKYKSEGKKVVLIAHSTC